MEPVEFVDAEAITRLFNKVVNLMTNHMRNTWARAGYPGLQEKDPRGPAKFMPPRMVNYEFTGSADKVPKFLTP